MTIQQTVEIDRNRRVLLLDQPLPKAVGIGRTKLTLVFPDVTEDGTTQTAPARIGFLKGSAFVPSDFDAMGQEEIIALFEGKA